MIKDFLVIIYEFSFALLQEERRRKDRQLRDDELEQHRHNLKLDEIDEAQFQTYANDVIQHCEQRGRNTYPLKRAAAAVSRQVMMMSE